MGFSLDPLVDGLHRVLDLRQEQHALTATNLANADTPGFKARVLDFDAALAEAVGDERGLAVETSDPRHLGGADQQTDPEIIELEPPAYSEDGNSVLAERETSRMVANGIVYNGVAKGLSKHLAMLRYAASDGRG